MAGVTVDVRTWGFDAFPTADRLLVRFVPSSSSTRDGVLLPLREERVEIGDSGVVTVDLASTVGTVPDAWYQVRFEWFDQHPVEGWVLGGFAELPGKLRVPAAGGNAADLIGDIKVGGPVLFFGNGAPPSWLPSGGVYIDLFAPEGADVYSEEPLIL